MSTDSPRAGDQDASTPDTQASPSHPGAAGAASPGGAAPRTEGAATSSGVAGIHGTAGVNGTAGANGTANPEGAAGAYAPESGPYAVPTDPAAYYRARWGLIADAEPVPAVRPGWRRTVLVALATAVVIAALGFPLARLWYAVSPKLTIQASGGAFYYTDIYGSQWAAWESLYVVISAATGILVAILSWVLLRRFRGPLMAVALALGCGLSGWIIWRSGRAIGRAKVIEEIKHPKDGAVITTPIDLRIQRNGLWHGFLPWIGGNLTYMAIAALITYCLIAGFSLRGDLNVGRKRTA
jgi:hypothetical protein